jgi:hypothetical protein
VLFDSLSNKGTFKRNNNLKELKGSLFFFTNNYDSIFEKYYLSMETLNQKTQKVSLDCIPLSKKQFKFHSSTYSKNIIFYTDKRLYLYSPKEKKLIAKVDLPELIKSKEYIINRVALINQNNLVWMLIQNIKPATVTDKNKSLKKTQNNFVCKVKFICVDMTKKTIVNEENISTLHNLCDEFDGNIIEYRKEHLHDYIYKRIYINHFTPLKIPYTEEDFYKNKKRRVGRAYGYCNFDFSIETGSWLASSNSFSGYNAPNKPPIFYSEDGKDFNIIIDDGSYATFGLNNKIYYFNNKREWYSFDTITKTKTMLLSSLNKKKVGSSYEFKVTKNRDYLYFYRTGMGTSEWSNFTKKSTHFTNMYIYIIDMKNKQLFYTFRKTAKKEIFYPLLNYTKILNYRTYIFFIP